MTPPKNQGQGHGAEGPAGSSAVSLSVLARRADYLKAAAARRHGTSGFLLQARDRADGEAGIRVGFTASKKIGNAVLRNRAKRRLRALAREGLAGLARPGWDYVLVARPGATVTRAYGDLRSDLESALSSVHRGRA
jgi:ribonuclease P protein component